MLFTVKGQVSTLVIFGAEEKEMFTLLSNQKANNLHMNLEGTELLQGHYSNVEIKLDEMFDGGDDEWHGSASIKADVEVIVDAQSEGEAIEVMNFFYNDSFLLDEAYVFISSGKVLKLDTMDSTYINWGVASAIHSGEVFLQDFIVSAKSHIDLIA